MSDYVDYGPQISALNGRIDSVEGTISGINNNINTMAISITTMEKSIKELEQRVETLEKLIPEIKELFESTKDSLTGIVECIDLGKKNDNTLLNRIKELLETATIINQSLQKLGDDTHNYDVHFTNYKKVTKDIKDITDNLKIKIIDIEKLQSTVFDIDTEVLD